ncbi:MAG TPA: zinc ribbon domain-containing protein [bacterium]|nr:zinc ribbon domain-containing protein [bacterium]
MPTYEYLCNECGHRFTAFQNITDESLQHCPECGSTPKRLISGGNGVIFKGPGFYATDYRKNCRNQLNNPCENPKRCCEKS